MFQGGKFVKPTTCVTYEPQLPSSIAQHNTSRVDVLSVLETARDEVQRHGSALRVIVGDSFGMGEPDVQAGIFEELRKKGFRIEDSGFMTAYGRN